MDESHSNLNGEQRLPSGTTFKLEPEKDKKILKKISCNIPLQASTNDRNANTESTRTGSSGSRNPETTLCSALRKLF